MVHTRNLSLFSYPSLLLFLVLVILSELIAVAFRLTAELLHPSFISSPAVCLLKILGTASGFSFLRFSKPMLGAKSESISKHSGVKWSEHNTECSLGPLHLARVL